MDSTRQDRAPGGDDRRRLTPRVERVEFDRNDFSVAVVYFKDDMDTVFTRKPVGEFRLTTSLGSDWYVRYREASNTFNWFWVSSRILRLTNPLTAQVLSGQTNKLIYLSGNLRGKRRFHLNRGILTRNLLDVDFPPPGVEAVTWDDKNSLLQIKWLSQVDFQGGSGEIIVQSADGRQYWTNNSLVAVEDQKSFTFFMDGPFNGTVLDARFYQIAASGWADLISGKTNDQIYKEWNA